MSTEVKSRLPRKSSFSLAALFYLIAIFGVLFSIAVQAAAAPNRDVWTASVGVGLLGAVLGGLIGLFHYRRWRGLSYGLLTGFVVGACVGPVLTSQNYGQIVATCLGGSLLLVILASVYRLREHTD